MKYSVTTYSMTEIGRMITFSKGFATKEEAVECFNSIESKPGNITWLKDNYGYNTIAVK